MSFYKYTLSFTLFLICFAACNKKTKNVSNENKETVKGGTEDSINNKITDINWYVANFPYQGKPYAPSKFYLFRISDNSIALHLDVNTCGLACEVSQRAISIKETPMCTEICCDSKEAMELSNLLRGKLTYNVSSSSLNIETPSGNIHLKKHQEGLSGTKWQAQSYADRKEGRKIKFSTDYYLVFENNKVQLILDVNSCNTSCTYNDRENFFELPAHNMGCTRKCCDSKDGELLMQSLQGKIKYVKEGNNLTLTTFNKEIIFVTNKNSDSNTQKE